MGLKVQGLGSRVQGLGIRVQGAGSTSESFEVRLAEAHGGVTSDAEGVTSPPSDVTVFSSDVIEDVMADERRGVVVTVTCTGVPRL